MSDEQRFTREMRESRVTGKAAQATLKTDDRVLARITDGIYRQPSSALRELISNAYDADATEVFVDLDAPKFQRIEVRDNGHGMDEDALSRMIHHIGGSSKRTSLGPAVGTTDSSDFTRSPGGRKLIGKIGIGLFSVSQLTSHFQIVTKTKGSSFRLFADVILKTYNEDGEDELKDGAFETGHVQVTSVPADDTDSHGTSIMLLKIHQRARDILRSKEVWARYLEQLSLEPEDRDATILPPAFHSGFLAKEPDPSDGEFIFEIEPVLPWEKNADPAGKFDALFQAVSDQVGNTTARPELAKALDTYLGIMWTLSLSAPVRYLKKHPFDLDQEDNIGTYLLTNARGQAKRLTLHSGQTVGSAAGLVSGSSTDTYGFSVFVDGVELRRPISFDWWPSQRQAITHPLIFVGSYSPDLTKVPVSIRGGDLEFEAYLFWNSQIVPKENNGVLIRINGASGALFDDTFMKYQVSEQTRLRQITAEIFVTKGLDAALNIDRESFNYAHPHYALLRNWLHRSLRQLTNTHKAIGDEIRGKEAEARKLENADRLAGFAVKSWLSARRGDQDRPPPVEMMSSPIEAAARRQQGVLVLDRTKISAVNAPPGKNAKTDMEDRESKVKAIATILDGFGVLEEMDYDRQHTLLNAILSVFFGDAQQ